MWWLKSNSASSKVQNNRCKADRSKHGRKKKSNVLRIESLERRQLLASDIAHNALIAEDVNADFKISSLDLLGVVNHLVANRRAARIGSSTADVRPAEGEAASNPTAYLDVNNDGAVSSLDLLQVVNRLRTREGAGELAQVLMFPVDANGNALPGQLVGGVMQYNVGVGQQFAIRTQVQDLRSTPLGVRSAYLDIDYSNQDGSSTSKIQALYSEFHDLTLTNVDGGTFRVTYGSQQTGDISVARTSAGAINRVPTATNIRNAIIALPQFAANAADIRVAALPITGANTVTFRIEFLNSFRGLNVANPVVSSQANLTAPAGQVASASITTFEDPSTTDAVFLSAVRYPANDNPNSSTGRPSVSFNATVFEEPSVQGTLKTISPGVFQMDEIGGVNTDFQVGEDFPEIAGNPFTIFEVDYRAAFPGQVLFTSNHFEGNGNSFVPDFGMTLVGSVEALASTVVIYPQFRLNIVTGIQAVNDSFPVSGTFNEDSGPFTLANVTANDLVIDGTLVGIVANSIVINPAFGTATIAAGNQGIIYTPAADFFGEATLTYTVANSLGQTSVGTVTINVTAVNDPPRLLNPQPTPPSAVEDTGPLVVPASVFFAPGPANESGTVRFVTAEAIDSTQGTASVNANGELVFSPVADFFGSVLVRVTASDNNNAVTPSAVTVTLNIIADNDPPRASAAPFSTNEDTPIELTIAQLFSTGPTNESGQVVTLSNPQVPLGQTGITVSINPVNGNLVVTPDADFFGDNLRFIVTGTDNGGGATNSTTATFSVNVRSVNDAPTANQDSFIATSVIQDATVLDVLANDSAGPANESKADLLIVSVSNQQNPSNGTITISADRKTILYKPATSVITGTDAFTYTIQDGEFTRSANVTIDITTPVRPFALRDNSSMVEGTPSLSLDVMANDLITAGATRELVSFTQPSQGTVTRNENGTPGDFSDDRLTFTPASQDFFGTVSFEYTLDDDAAGSNPSIGTVTIQVTEVNDTPAVAASQTIATAEDATNFVIGSSLLLAGSSAGPLEAAQTLTVTSVRSISGGVSSVRVENGDVIFTAVSNFVGNAVFEFTATDNGTTNGVSTPLSTTGLVTISLTPVNDAPTTTPKSATVAEDNVLNIPFSTILAGNQPGPANAADELANQELIVTGATVLSGGGVADLVAGNIRFTPAGNYNGPVVIEYTVQDREINPTLGFRALTAKGLINITVTEVNDAPENFTATRSIFAGLPETINLTNELGATSRGATNENEGATRQTLIINRIIPGSVVGGTAMLNANGTITFLAPLGSSGVGSFEVETIDNGTTTGAPDAKFGRGVVTLNIRPFIPSSVSGNVWIDDDKDGLIDSDEHALSGVEVFLTGTSVAEGGGAVSRTTMTKADGTYNFALLPPGTYTVSYVNPTGTIDGHLANSVVHSITVPGGANLTSNFNVFGLDVRYSSVLDNLAEGYYNRNPAARGKGIDAVILADGSMAFSTVLGGYTNIQFAEVILINGGRDAVLSIVGQDSTVRSAMIPRGRYFVTRDNVGNTYIKIVALESELAFFSAASATANAIQSVNYLDAVDSYFSALATN